jgi:hypothetical protein
LPYLFVGLIALPVYWFVIVPRPDGPSNTTAATAAA